MPHRPRTRTVHSHSPEGANVRRHTIHASLDSFVSICQTASRSVQLVLHSSWQSVVGHIGAICRKRLNLCFLHPPESTTQTANRSVQPFLHRLTTESPYTLYNEHPYPQNCPFSMGDLDLHLTHPCPYILHNGTPLPPQNSHGRI